MLDLLFERMSHFGIELGAISVVGSAYLRASRVIEGHYGVINRIAHEGRSALSPDAESELTAAFADQLAQDARVLGAFEVLDAFPGLTPTTLEERVDASGSSRLASGTYCSSIEVDGTPILVLNGFHPAQVEYYTAPGRSLVLMEGLTDLAWQSLRTDFTGATNPAKAVDGSVRAELRTRAAELGIDPVDQSRNCVHCSAGPIEGLAELARFLGVAHADTRTGSALAEAGFTPEEIDGLAGNEVVDPESGLSAFDATEEIDTSTAVDRLRELAGSRAG